MRGGPGWRPTGPGGLPGHSGAVSPLGHAHLNRDGNKTSSHFTFSLGHVYRFSFRVPSDTGIEFLTEFNEARISLCLQMTFDLISLIRSAITGLWDIGRVCYNDL